MKTKTGMSIGLALTLMVGVFATMLALGLFTNSEVRANAPTAIAIVAEVDGDEIEGVVVDTGDATTVTTFPERGTVVGTLDATHADDEAGHPEDEDLKWGIGTADDAALFKVDEDTGVLSFKAGPDFESPADDGTNNGYIVPITVTHGDDPDTVFTDDIEITVTDVVEVSGVSVDHTPGGVGETAKITVKFTLEEAPTEADGNLLPSQDTITIEFEDDVQVPSVLDERFITIVGFDETVRRSANPLDATVSFTGTPADEPVVTLTVGDQDPTDAGVGGVDDGEVTVIFRQGAGIKNPTEQGDWDVKVSTNKHAVATTGDDGDFHTWRAISLNKKSGTRGSTITATGSGFKNSTTATVFLDNNPQNDKKDPDEVVLCDAEIGGTDTFSCSFTVNVPPFQSDNTINAVDGREGYARTGAPWGLDPQVVANPDVAAIGDTVSVELRDFPKGKNSTTFGCGRRGGSRLRRCPDGN